MPQERPIISFLVNIIGNHHYFTLEHERVKINQFLTFFLRLISIFDFRWDISFWDVQIGARLFVYDRYIYIMIFRRNRADFLTLFDMQIVCLDHVDYYNFNGVQKMVKKWFNGRNVLTLKWKFLPNYYFSFRILNRYQNLHILEPIPGILLPLPSCSSRPSKQPFLIS